MLIPLLLCFLLAHQGCLGGDFDVALIGFNSAPSYKCIDHSETRKRTTIEEQPSLTWYRAIIGTRQGADNSPDHQGFCVWRSKTSVKNSVETLINDAITNSTIASLVNRTNLICAAVSNRYFPVIRWTALGFPNMTLSSTVVFTPASVSSRLSCQTGFQTVSILRVNDPSKAYRCSIDQRETCSIEIQCERRALINRRTLVLSSDRRNSSLNTCRNITDGPCAELTNRGPRLAPSQRRVDEFVARMQIRSQSDLERVCHLLYPPCLGSNDSPVAVSPLCREDCYSLKYTYWKNWSTLARYAVGPHGRKWTGCGELPSVWDNNTTTAAVDRGSKCQQPTRKAFDLSKLRTDCFVEKDRHYAGVVNRTANGLTCQRWDIYPELLNAENYCRNPRGLQSRPWCYTTDPTIRIAFCTDIPECPPTLNPSGASSDRLAEEAADEAVPLYAAVGAGVAFTLLSVLVFVVRRWHSRKYPRRAAAIADEQVRFRKASTSSTLTEDAAIAVERLQSRVISRDPSISNIPQNDLYFLNDRGLDRRLEPLEMPRSGWTVIERLACGEMNDVFLAQLRSHPAAFYRPNRRPQLVVVKLLKDDAQRQLFENFVQEASLAASCHHHRIVALLGVSFVTPPTCILFEYVALGDLKTILEAEGGSTNGCFEELETVERIRRGWTPPLSHPRRRADICYQISDGMVYLCNQRIVHRDLAARNILVDEKLQIKISDFGLSKRVDSVGGLYVATECERLPVRWTAPEAWTHRQFSTKSDVWSFGVFVWELLSLGMQPYMGKSHREVVEAVVNRGETLRTPAACDDGTSPSYVVELETIGRELMQPCFAYRPEDRPDFIVLMAKAASLRERFKTVGNGECDSATTAV